MGYARNLLQTLVLGKLGHPLLSPIFLLSMKTEDTMSTYLHAMTTLKSTKIDEMTLKVHLVKWLKTKGFQYWSQEFEFMRRPDVIAFSFSSEHSISLADVFHRIPFDYLAANFKKKRFSADMLIEKFGLRQRGTVRDLNHLVKCGFLAKSEKGYRVISTEPFLARLTSIECKIKDWKKGLDQAITYKMLFSMESYLALPQNRINNVDKTLFRKNGIGLLSIDDHGCVHEEIKPKSRIDSFYVHSASASIAHNFKSHSLKKIQPVS
jgi:hypothetical protein